VALERRRVVRVPASSANLGPGFDSFAAALALHLEVEIAEGEEFVVETDLDVPRDASNLVVRAFERLHPTDGLRFTIRSEVPLSGGLGSSAAAIVAGLMAADHLYELDADLFAHAAELEGHPDNVAAALHGGVVVCADGRPHRLDVPLGLEAVLVVPHAALATHAARAALPAQVPLEDAVFNTAHGALLMLGLATADLELVARGLQDRLHQPLRAHLYPRSYELTKEAGELGALGATISGAGPSVLVWCQYEQTGGVVEALRRRAQGWADVIRAPFESQGAFVQAL
jgi:homoserine kinase